MTLETSDRKQKAQYWPYYDRDGHGNVRVGSRQELSVRWVDKSVEAVDASGNPITLDASAILDQEVDIGSIMWQGTLAQYNAASSHTFYKVVEMTVVPDIRGRNHRYVANLMRYKNTLPTVVS